MKIRALRIKSMLVINQEQVKKIIPLGKAGEVIKVVEQAFGDYGGGNVQMPPKTYLFFKEYEGDLRVMPSYSPRLKMAGTKIVNVHPNNPKIGLFTVMASIVLNEAKTGLPISLLDGTYITGMRTGAAGAVASKYLARENAETLGVIGAGQQAIYQIAAITKVRKIKEIFVFDINEKNIKNLEKVLGKEKIKIRSASIEEAAGKDILVTTTPSREPIIKKSWIKPGTHINAIGADAPNKEELDPEILKGAKVILDDWEQASHSGEINVPFSKGLFRKEDVYASLGEIVAGKKPGRENDQEVTVFDSTGLALQDLYTANLVFKAAKRKKIGKEVKIF